MVVHTFPFLSVVDGCEDQQLPNRHARDKAEDIQKLQVQFEHFTVEDSKALFVYSYELEGCEFQVGGIDCEGIQGLVNLNECPFCQIYREMNRAMRECTVNLLVVHEDATDDVELFCPLIFLIDTAISHLEERKPELSFFLFRGMSIPADKEKQYYTGRTACWKQFSSASFARKVCLSLGVA